MFGYPVCYFSYFEMRINVFFYAHQFTRFFQGLNPMLCISEHGAKLPGISSLKMLLTNWVYHNSFNHSLFICNRLIRHSLREGEFRIVCEKSNSHRLWL